MIPDIAAPIRILLIEDNPVDAKLVSVYLKHGLRVPHEVSQCTELAPALTLLKNQPVEVILLDLSLPDCSGYTTFTMVRDAAPDAPIVVLTGSEDEALAVQAIQEGAQDYLLKSSLTAAMLGRTIRYGIERRRLQDGLRQRDRQLHTAHKLEAVGQLAAGVAHEINTPLQFIGDNLRFTMDQITALVRALDTCSAVMDAERPSHPRSPHITAFDTFVKECDLGFLREELPRALSESASGLDHIKEIVQALKRVAMTDGALPVSVSVNQLIADAMAVAQGIVKHCARIDHIPDPASSSIRGFPASLIQVLLDIVSNAAQAIQSLRTPAHVGVITITSATTGSSIELRIHDNGPGIPPAVAHRIFEPFFTTKPVGQGSGQSLAIARAIIVNDHGGDLTFESDDTGTTFIVRLPLWTSQPP